MSDSTTPSAESINFFSAENTAAAPTLVVRDLDLDAAPTPEIKKGKLCLNMIVKNESRIIKRMLDSVIGIIDTYCICDTGSTDDTAAIIREYMDAAGKQGIVYSEPFRNFGYNRSHALDRAAEYGEYALLLDADMKLVVSREFDKAALVDAGYTLLQKNGDLEYYNVRIVKTGIGVKCVGPTHEYYSFPAGNYRKKLTTAWIDDVGDGGAKADKFERDIRLLRTALDEEPNNARYVFYLAQSYNHSKQYEEAYAAYKQRVALGDWIEERFYAALEAGNVAKRLGRSEEAVHWWLEAYNLYPKRAESLYELTKFYREAGKHHAAQAFCDLGKRVPYPKDDVLFIKKAVYEYMFDYEQSILAYYTRRPVHPLTHLKLMGYDAIRTTVLGNYKFYAKRLSEMPGVREHVFSESRSISVNGREDDFVSSSPSIISYNDPSHPAAAYLMNVRYVNYRIAPNGAYNFKHSDGKITTLNKTLWLAADLSVVHERWIDRVANPELRYQGVEDVKLFVAPDGGLEFLGTVEHPETGRLCVGHGTYVLDGDCLYPTPFLSPRGRTCEKNWCYFTSATDGALQCVYEWSPLTIGFPNSDGATLCISTTDKDCPPFFRDVRGSSNGVRVDDEVWFLCHYVHYSTPRHYYHIVVVLDAATFKFKRHSVLFKFTADSIEYALGFVVEAARVLISYSRMDRSSAVLEIPRERFEREYFVAAGPAT